MLKGLKDLEGSNEDQTVGILLLARSRAYELLAERPLRQWVLSLPHALRHLLADANLTGATGGTGAVRLVQRFGSALNLNVHFHMILSDGVYLTDGADPPVFRHVNGPGAKALQVLVERDIENAWLAAERRFSDRSLLTTEVMIETVGAFFDGPGCVYRSALPPVRS